MRILLFFLSLLLPLNGQQLTKEEVESRIEANKAAADDPVAADALKIWEEVLSETKAAEAALASEASIRKEIQSIEKAPALQLPAELPEGTERVELEAQLKKVEDLIKENDARLAGIEDQAKQAPGQMVALIADEEKLRAELQLLEVPPLTAGEVETASHHLALQKKSRIEARLKEITARKDLIDAQTKNAGGQVTASKGFGADLAKLKTSLEARIEGQKKKEAAETREAIEEYTKAFEAIPEFAKVVEDLSVMRSSQDKVEKMLSEAKAYDEKVAEIGSRIEKQYEAAKLRIDLLEKAGIGVDDDTGMLLRGQRASLPSVDEISDELAAKLEMMARAEITLSAETERLRDLSVISEERLDELLLENPEITRKAVDELFKRREENIGKLVKEYRSLNEELGKGTAAARRTIDDIQIYSSYLDERLLWIKSAKLLSWSEIPAEWGRVVDLVWSEEDLFEALSERFQGENLVKLLAAVLISVAILFRRKKLFGILKKSSEQAVRRNCTSLRPTLEFIGAAVLLSLWAPLILYGLVGLTGDSMAWQTGLARLANFLFLAALLLKFSRPDGLFVNHFRIHPDRAALVYRNLQWLVFVSPAFVFFVPALTALDDDPASGRVAFILGMLVLMAFLHHLFHPKRSILVKGAKSTGYSKFWYFLIILCPIVFIIGAVLGYLESVLTLRDQAGGTGGLLLLAFLVIRFLTRWTLVSRRKLAITQALRRREIALAEKERQEEGETDPSLPSLEEVKAEAIDVVEVEEQTTKLFKIAVYSTVFFGLWAIWSSTLPALSVLDKVELWRSGPPAVSEGASTPAIPGIPSAGGEQGKGGSTILVDDGRVTLQDLLLTFVFFGFTFVAARNIPGLLSLTLFNRIKLGPGGNFALTTTLRYVIVFTGIVLALGQIGITWGKVQWLAAAVSLGIGFGLQEIFANFVAGIILLFERPIRLGDIVTVGDISGSVTQIKIRATTIKQFNNRELLVPNKEFITSQLVNWTLNDSILRLEIQVGIAYGSDTEKARGILEKLLRDHPNVMDDPGPSVFFMGFGASTLDFEARGFVASADFLLGTKSELHYQIDEAFREAGIEIAFPQQDIHLRSVPDGMSLSKD